MRAIQIGENGGPEALATMNMPDPEPGPGEVLVRVEAAGVNFIDVYQREGRYPIPLPFTPGLEGAGEVVATGKGVDTVRPGDRVAWASQLGSYAELVRAKASVLVPVPSGLDSRQAAAAMLQGMTAHYLTHSTYSLEAGDTALVHAAAGGVGLLLVQMAKRAGARVLGTVSTDEKAELARQAGADELILYTHSDFEAEVKRLTDGTGVDVVYDSVGKSTFDKSLNCLKPLGMLVLFGGSSGAVPPFDPIVLSQKGSLFLTRPTLGHYTATREALLARAKDVFAWVLAGELALRIEHEYALEDAARAHRDLEGRKTTGKLLLRP